MVKRVNTGLTNPLLLYAGRIELLKSWREESPYWLYTQPNLVFDSSIQAFADFEAFAEEIKLNRRIKNGKDRQDYFHELRQFNDGDLKMLRQSIIEQIDEANETVDNIRKDEPDQYSAGRPVMGVPEGNGPKARQKVFEFHKAEIEAWLNTPQGKATVLKYEGWKKRLQDPNEYHGLLLKVLSDVDGIIATMSEALPNIEEQQVHTPKVVDVSPVQNKENTQKRSSDNTPLFTSFSDLFINSDDIDICIDALRNYRPEKPVLGDGLTWTGSDKDKGIIVGWIERMEGINPKKINKLKDRKHLVKLLNAYFDDLCMGKEARVFSNFVDITVREKFIALLPQ